MNRVEFISCLETQLSKIPQAERDEILYDYEEHFSIGLEHGKSEEEIAQDLGDPKAIGKQFTADAIVKQAAQSKTAGGITRAVFAIAGLGFFNLFFVLGPFLVLAGLLVALFAASVAIMLSGLALVFSAFAAPVFPGSINLAGINPAVIVFSGIGLASFGALCFIGMIYVAKWFFQGILWYLNLNVRLIKTGGIKND
ncbi:MAG: DUF1700 domain-containing protein [Syntrophomonas sp.]